MSPSQAIGGVFAVLVHSLDGVEHRRHHRGGRDLGVVQHFVVELLGMRDAVEGQRHRNHVWLAIEAAHDARAAVLHERADRLGGVDDLEGVLRRSQRGQHRRLGHRHIDVARLQQRMSAGQQMRVVEIGDGASSGDVHVAAHQNCADRRARLQRFRLLVVADRARAHHRNDAGGGEILGEQPQRVLAESAEDQRRLDGLEQVGVAGLRTRPAGQAWSGGAA